MNMVEIVARALWEERRADPEQYLPVWKILEPDEKKEWLATSRLVLLAIRDNVTPWMVATGEGYSDFILPAVLGNNSENRKREMKMAFCAMLDQALKEIEA
jgi:hypothetical protein